MYKINTNEINPIVKFEQCFKSFKLKIVETEKSSFTALGHSSEEDPVTTQTVGGVSGGQPASGASRTLSSF